MNFFLGRRRTSSVAMVREAGGSPCPAVVASRQWSPVASASWVNPKIALLEQWTELGHSYVLWLVVHLNMNGWSE